MLCIHEDIHASSGNRDISTPISAIVGAAEIPLMSVTDWMSLNSLIRHQSYLGLIIPYVWCTCHSKKETFIDTKWLPGSVFSVGFRINRQKVIAPCCSSRVYVLEAGLKACGIRDAFSCSWVSPWDMILLRSTQTLRFRHQDS